MFVCSTLHAQLRVLRALYKHGAAYRYVSTLL